MRFITASAIFSGKGYLATNSVLVLNEEQVIVDIVPANTIEQSSIEFHEGILCPGFINTHCHLELSHLKDKIQPHTGIVDFALGIIKNRNQVSEEVQLEYMKEADRLMMSEGIVAVGDISNTGLSASVKKESTLFYHTFVELIGLNPQNAQLIYETGKKIEDVFAKNNLSCSLSPHAPYSTSLPLIKHIATDCEIEAKPMTIHNQESEAENLFFKAKQGNYLRLYTTLNIPIDYFQASEKSSLQTIADSFSKEVNTLLVHNTFTDQEDITVVHEKHEHIYWCLCPNANLYIENTLPDIELLKQHNCKLTIGTDSLASNSSLSIIDEINVILKKYPTIGMEFLLQSATINGAQYLGIENQFGTFEKNKKPGVNLIEKTVEGNYTVKKLA